MKTRYCFFYQGGLYSTNLGRRMPFKSTPYSYFYVICIKDGVADNGTSPNAGSKSDIKFDDDEDADAKDDSEDSSEDSSEVIIIFY